MILVPVLIVLTSGTFAALSNKSLYDFKAQGTCGYHGFEKPYFLTFAMFVGEMLCLFVYFAKEWWGLESSKIWVSRLVCRWVYYYDHESARRARERAKDGLTHGIEPYSSEHVKGAGSATSFGEAFGDDDMEEQDEEKSLLGQSGALNYDESTEAQPSYPTLHRRTIPSNNALLDQDLLDLHLSEEEQRRRRDANKPSKFVYLGLCLFDLSASAIGGIGLMYLDASSNQMLRGSSVVFTAIASRFILRRSLSWKQWSGIMSVVAGLALVGMCGVFRANNTLANTAGAPIASAHNQVSPSGALLGLLLVLSGSALNSIQNVFEELLVKRVGADAIDALEIVGYEGMFGVLLTGGIVLPIVQAMPGSNCGSIESTADSWHLMTHSGLIFFLVIGYTLSLAFMNAYSVVLSKEVSAVFRQLINALRVVFIWVISILLFYIWTHRTMGEGWDAYSYFQLAGFALLLFGTLIYGTKETTESDSHDGAFSIDPSRPDTPPPSHKRTRTQKTAPLRMTPDGGEDGRVEEQEEVVDEYDENGNRKPSVAIHIGNGRSSSKRGDKSARSAARSPGVETVPLPDAKLTPKQLLQQMGTIHSTVSPPISSRATSRKQRAQQENAPGILDPAAPEPEQL